ncbi:nitrate reductase molybdenum cofactor assembly chaperone [Paenibacillus apiarius]|uniref:Nitrate reductase molybdenum cofactor assembly chaperone n=1 Tax=Paenibacillus apiarius TaxID=46240 RepID=A0ABT4E0V8_9BACL|nr:nitrate reductase molybdenum cofactor assembly chaperone [Paenibacillus apiarius]MBN3526488.1 nitrate reductase molybdenum cofactor assembly chaperone [Paenibacillus apiarius]MCY9517060.1 nitrate reductase molybdenum cofactor assembly chaperone [Paenibacillus apiarius]MCY9523232.1 nitrate reductase molybdenum cofactor assembly chaperone [Paenibacillus apiarius]MCY9554270.1 nitrate reductase molybdenum cofactor assembly chaperone [Paenibacillus apiarius]MCY9560881.1 nitrate reductase molybde
MEEQQRFILLAVSRVLGYPHDDFPNEREELAAAIRLEAELDGIRERLLTAMAPLYELTLRELQEQYVQTFDWKENTGLYLTAHEWGDSRERGAALVLLQNILNDAGFEPVEGELADYLPALYELLAAAPDNVHLKALKRRLAVATKRVSDQLPTGHPYTELFDLLVQNVFGVPSTEDISLLEQKREEADLDELPFPILYGMDGTARQGCSLPDLKICK